VAGRAYDSCAPRTSRVSAPCRSTSTGGDDMPPPCCRSSPQVNACPIVCRRGATFDVLRMDPTVLPTLAFSLTAHSRSPTELLDLAMFEIRRCSHCFGLYAASTCRFASRRFRVVRPTRQIASH